MGSGHGDSNERRDAYSAGAGKRGCHLTQNGVSLALLRPTRDGIRVNTVDSVAELTLYVYHHGRETQDAGKATGQKPAQLDFIAPVPRHQAHKAVR